MTRRKLTDIEEEAAAERLRAVDLELERLRAVEEVLQLEKQVLMKDLLNGVEDPDVLEPWHCGNEVYVHGAHERFERAPYVGAVRRRCLGTGPAGPVMKSE